MSKYTLPTTQNSKQTFYGDVKLVNQIPVLTAQWCCDVGRVNERGRQHNEQTNLKLNGNAGWIKTHFR